MTNPAQTSPPMTDLPPGHIGNLTAKEVDALKEVWRRLFELFQQEGKESPPLKKEVKKSSGLWGLSSPKREETKIFLEANIDPNWKTLPPKEALTLIPGKRLEQTFWNLIATDNPDSGVLRFLRARKWDIDEAYFMLCNTLRWRLVMRIDEIVALGETGLTEELNRLKMGAGDEFLKQLHSGKASLGGPDKSGRGVCFINVQFHHKEDQSFETVQLLVIYVLETSRLFWAHPNTTACVVFNLDNFTLANMDNDSVKFLLKCLEAYYPETLGQCILHKAPWIFSTVWGLISGWLDPIVAKKIFFTDNLDEFSKHIDIQNVPSFISGNVDMKTKDEATKCEPPKPGQARPDESLPEVKAYREAIENYKEVTVAWLESSDSTEHEQNDASHRLEHGRDYSIARVKAEKFLRGPTMYHEKGLVRLTDDGRLEMDFGNDNNIKGDVS